VNQKNEEENNKESISNSDEKTGKTFVKLTKAQRSMEDLKKTPTDELKIKRTTSLERQGEHTKDENVGSTIGLLVKAATQGVGLRNSPDGQEHPK